MITQRVTYNDREEMGTVDWVQDDSDSTSIYSIFNRDNNYWLNYGCVTIGKIE